jgi:hypothetical protein
MRKSYRRANFHLLMMIVGKLMSYQSFLIVAAQLHFPSFRGACSSCSTSSTELEMQILFRIGSWEWLLIGLGVGDGAIVHSS